MTKAREILKFKCMAKGYELKEDDCIYRKDKVVAKDVRIVEDNFDSIIFEMNVDGKFGDLGLYDK